MPISSAYFIEDSSNTFPSSNLNPLSDPDASSSKTIQNLNPSHHPHCGTTSPHDVVVASLLATLQCILNSAPPGMFMFFLNVFEGPAW